MDYLVYLLFWSLARLFRFLPFRVVYIVSDFLSLLVFSVAGYRKQVIYENIRRSFPEKSEEEIREIIRQFYHHFTDMLVESLKGVTMTEKEVSRRYRVLNPEILNSLYDKGKSVITVGGHYGNWEWAGIVAGDQIRHLAIGFYKPLSNRYIDDYIRKIRIRGRSRLASITHTAETFRTNYGEPAIFYMIADQSPSSPRLAYWMDFLNQDTAVLHGPEKYARMHRLPVVFAIPRRIARGKYEMEIFLITEDPADMAEGEITRTFMKLLEKEIRRAPQFYLWSHRRWKLSRK